MQWFLPADDLNLNSDFRSDVNVRILDHASKIGSSCVDIQSGHHPISSTGNHVCEEAIQNNIPALVVVREATQGDNRVHAITYLL